MLEESWNRILVTIYSPLLRIKFPLPTPCQSRGSAGNASSTKIFTNIDPSAAHYLIGEGFQFAKASGPRGDARPICSLCRERDKLAVDKTPARGLTVLQANDHRGVAPAGLRERPASPPFWNLTPGVTNTFLSCVTTRLPAAICFFTALSSGFGATMVTPPKRTVIPRVSPPCGLMSSKRPTRSPSVNA